MSHYLRMTFLAVVILVTASKGLIIADDHNFDIGPGGSAGVPSAWDSESVNLLDGNVHLEIPIYGVASSDSFGMGVALRYDSKVWDASDLNYSSDPARQTNRSLIAKSVFGLGWKLNFGRVYSLAYAIAGGFTETYWYFQGMDGDVHRLFAKSPIRIGPLGRERCAWEEDPYHYTLDGSGIRASIDDTGTVWSVWLPDGTKYTMTRSMINDVNTPEQINYRGFYTTSIESAVRKGDGSPYRVTISYVAPTDTARRYCPDRVRDDFGREIVFDCQATTRNGIPVDGGVVNSITVPAPHGQSLTYNLDYSVTGIYDPFQCPAGGLPCTLKQGVLLLTSITAQGVSPPHSFQFDYTAPVPTEENRTNFGELNSVTLPNGGQRIYAHGEYRMWRKDYPGIYTGSLANQFSFFPNRGVVSRKIIVDGRTWRWDYNRENDPSCTETTPNSCFNHPTSVRTSGPYDPADSSVGASSTVSTFYATPASTSTPAPLDGLVSSTRLYAGSPDPTRLLRTTTMTYAYDVPQPNEGYCYVGNSIYFKNHYLDNLRITRIGTVFEDDGKTIHDQRVVENNGWVMLTGNYGRFQERREYGPDGVTLYRKSLSEFALTAAQRAAWVLTPVASVRVLDVNSVVKLETDFQFDDSGRTTSQRQLFSPGPAPRATSTHDVLKEFGYDVSTANLNTLRFSIPGSPFPDQQRVFTQLTDLWASGYPVRQHMDGLAWNSLDVDRDSNTGLVTSNRGPSGTGVSISYDKLGRQTAVLPLAASGDPPVDFTYDTNPTYGTPQITRVVGGVGSPTSIQARTILDGLGRVKEEQFFNQAGQWVSRKFTRDAFGNVLTVSEWAPVGSTGALTTIARSGTYDGTVNIYADPFVRIRKRVGPDGAITLRSYQGLVTTTTVQGIRGGSVSDPTPTLINSVTADTYDIFGRLSNTATKAEGAAVQDRVMEYRYDELDHNYETKMQDLRLQPPLTPVYQTRSASYDKLGRVTILYEPERGKTWFGSVLADGTAVDSDGYDALGNVIRHEDAYGYSAVTRSHYRKTYDGAGRLTMVQNEEDVTLARTTMAEFAYDASDHGTGQSQNGQLCAAKSYDGMALAAQTDYYYNGPFGRFNKMTASLAGWGTPYNSYYTYDSLGQVSSIAYPTTAAADPVSGMPPCSNLTCLTALRSHGSVTHIGSSRGYDMVSSAVYNDAGILQEWVSGNSMKTQILPDPNMKSRPGNIRVSTVIWDVELWSSGGYSYDGAGSIKAIGSDKFTYDSIGRLKEAQVGSGGTLYNQIFSYDPFGNVDSKTNTVSPGPPVVTTYNLDATTNRIRGLGTADTWTYDNDGALKHDETFDYGYDNARRLKMLQSSGTDRGSYLYDAFGLRIHRKEDHGKEVFYFRDRSGNVLSQFSRPVNLSTMTPQWDRDFVYFDGKRISMIEEPAPSAPSWTSSQATTTQISLQWYANPESDIYGYLVYRKAASESGFSPLFNGASSITTSGTSYIDTLITSGTTYTYKIVAVDNAGNQGSDSAQRLITAGDATPPPAPTNLTGSADDCYVALSWAMPSYPPDLAGFKIYRRLVSGTYGSPRNISPITVTGYTDLAVTSMTRYYYVVKSVDTAGNLSTVASNEVNARPVCSGGGGGPPPAFDIVRQGDDEVLVAPYAVIGQSGPPVNVLFLHSDHLGSLRLVTNTSGYIVTTHKYLPFGEEVQVMRTMNPYHFAGYERDSESGMDYVRARFYTPARSRWLSSDPLGGGYAYAASTPLNMYDPSGLLPMLFPSCPADQTCVFIPGGPETGNGGYAPIGHVEIVLDGPLFLFHETQSNDPVFAPSDWPLHSLNGVPRSPDVFDLGVNVSLYKYLAYTFGATMDSNGNVYDTPGGLSVGKTWSPSPVSVSLTVGYLGTTLVPNDAQLRAAASGPSVGVAGGYILGGGVSQSPGALPIYRFGFYFPLQVGGDFKSTRPIP